MESSPTRERFRSQMRDLALIRMQCLIYAFSYCPLAVDMTDRFVADGIDRGGAVIRITQFASERKE